MCDQRDCQGECGGGDAEGHAVAKQARGTTGWAVSTFGTDGGFAVAVIAAGVMAGLAGPGLRTGPGRAR